MCRELESVKYIFIYRNKEEEDLIIKIRKKNLDKNKEELVNLGRKRKRN